MKSFLINCFLVALCVLASCKKDSTTDHSSSPQPVVINVNYLAPITTLDLKITDQRGSILFQQDKIGYFPLTFSSVVTDPGNQLTISYNTPVVSGGVSNADVEVSFTYNNQTIATITGSHFKTPNGYTISVTVPK